MILGVPPLICLEGAGQVRPKALGWFVGDLDAWPHSHSW
jgi:hypothetical protein